MTVTIESAVASLKETPLVDNGALKSGGHKEVLDEIDRWKSKGLSARVLVVGLGDDFKEWLGIWEKLGLDQHKDLVLVFNTRDWVAKGWGLDEKQINAALEIAKPSLKKNFARGLVRALDELGARANTGGMGLAPIIGGSIGLVAVGGVFGLVINRRNKLAKEGRAAIAAAKGSAEKAYSELILACEELPSAQGTELQLKAGELKKRMDALVQEAEAKPAAKSDSVTLGKIRHFENEFAALRSTSLQEARRMN